MEGVPLPLDSLFLGRPSSSRLQLRSGTKSRHSDSSSRPGTAKIRLPRPQPKNKSEEVGIPRASSAPLVWDNHVNLEIHSTPVSLTTRSLSNHPSTTSSALRPSSVCSGRSKRGHNSHTNNSTRQHTQPPGNKSTSAVEGNSHRNSKSRRTARRGNMAAQFSSSKSNMMDNTSSRPPSSSSVTREHTVGVDVRLGCGSQQSLEQVVTVAEVRGSTSQEESAPVIKGSLQSRSQGGGKGGEGKGGEGEGGRRGERESAARRIQEWYRSSREKQRAEVQSLLQEKKEELHRSHSEHQRNLQKEEACREREEEERRQRRQEKMRATRQAAIQSLHQQREEQRRESERIAQQEIVLLQASGKIKRRGPQTKKKRKKERVGGEEREARTEKTAPSTKQSSPKQLAEDPPSQSVPDSVITEFFEAGSSRKSLSKNNSQSPSKPSISPPPRHSHTPPTIPKAASMYTDILDTLKLLEEAPPPLPGTKSPPTNQRSKSRANPSSSASTYLTPTSLGHRNDTGRVGGGTKLSTTSTSLSESKLQSILSYLDEMERADGELVTQLSQARGQGRGVPPVEGGALECTSNKVTGSNGGCGLGEELEAATAVATDVTTTILAQRMELDNKNKTVEMLQKALSQQRELTVYHAQEMEKEGQRRLELQKQEYETTIQRHQCFIDQLIEDKKTLSERCEQLVRDLKETSTKYQTKLKTVEETHGAELSKVRQVAAATDKLRREKWRAEESQRIKEATVRSLEPEIQRIIAKGKADIQRLKTLHEAELLQADERAGRRFVAQMEELRAQCATEKEQACAHERELARQRYEKLAEQEEMSAQQQRRRLFAELQMERDKMAAQCEQQRKGAEQQLADSQEAHSRELEEARREHSRAMEEAERRHGSQLRAVEERLATERGAWQENFTRKQETILLAREREMRESLRQERDKEIEMVISRLELEAETTRNQNEKAAEARIKRIREKCEAELSEVERSERSTQEKLTTTKQELGEREGELARLRSLLRQKEEEINQVGEVATKLSKERDNVTDVVRQEFADRLVSTEEENRRIKIEMSELRARHRLELERAQREKERELEEVHSRVRQALVKKEENLSSLHSQHEAALKRAEHLEMLLERQRRELLKK